MAWAGGTSGLLGLLAIALGIVTLRTGWVLPTARYHIRRPKLHGLGALFTGMSPLLQSLFYFGVLPSASWETRFSGGNAFLLGGLLLIAVSQLLPPHRNTEHTELPS